MPKFKIIDKRLWIYNVQKPQKEFVYFSKKQDPNSFDTSDIVIIKPTDPLPDFEEVFSNQSQEILRTRKDGTE